MDANSSLQAILKDVVSSKGSLVDHWIRLKFSGSDSENSRSWSGSGVGIGKLNQCDRERTERLGVGDPLSSSDLCALCIGVTLFLFLGSIPLCFFFLAREMDSETKVNSVGRLWF